MKICQYLPELSKNKSGTFFMAHGVVNKCQLTMLPNGGLQWLHLADDDTVNWLARTVMKALANCKWNCMLQAADTIWSCMLLSQKWRCNSWQSSLPWLWRANAESDVSASIIWPATGVGEWSHSTSRGVCQAATVL